MIGNVRQRATGEPAGSAAGAGRADRWMVLTVGQFAAVIAVLQRSSLGVATTDALARFGITAATLAAFSMVQLLVYAALQVPVGVLIDRYGSRLLIVLGSLIMAGRTGDVRVRRDAAGGVRRPGGARDRRRAGVHQRHAAGARVVPAGAQREAHQRDRAGQPARVRPVRGRVRRGPRRDGVDPVVPGRGRGQRRVRGAGARCCCATRRSGGRRACPSGQALAAAGRGVREAWAEPGTRLGFWLGFMALFTGMAFGVMWGYPFLTLGQGLSPGTAGALMLGLAVAGLVYGVTLGTFMARHPYYRSLIAIGVVGVVAAIWAVVLLWPGRAPLWLLVVLVLTVPAPTIGAVMTFDIARTSNPPARLGSAIGVVNGGAFLGTLIAVMGIGLVLQVTTPAGRPTTPSTRSSGPSRPSTCCGRSGSCRRCATGGGRSTP